MYYARFSVPDLLSGTRFARIRDASVVRLVDLVQVPITAKLVSDGEGLPYPFGFLVRAGRIDWRKWKSMIGRENAMLNLRAPPLTKQRLFGAAV